MSPLCGRLKLDLGIARGPRSYESAVRAINAGFRDRAGTALVRFWCAGALCCVGARFFRFNGFPNVSDCDGHEGAEC
jgi:hypothetical protein